MHSPENVWAARRALAHSSCMTANMQRTPPPAPPVIDGPAGGSSPNEDGPKPTPSDVLDHLLYGLRTATEEDVVHAWLDGPEDTRPAPSASLVSATLAYWRVLAAFVDVARVERPYSEVRRYLVGLGEALPAAPSWSAELVALDGLEAIGEEPVR